MISSCNSWYRFLSCDGKYTESKITGMERISMLKIENSKLYFITANGQEMSYDFGGGIQ